MYESLLGFFFDREYVNMEECPSYERDNVCRKKSHFVSDNLQLLRYVATWEAELGTHFMLVGDFYFNSNILKMNLNGTN